MESRSGKASQESAPVKAAAPLRLFALPPVSLEAPGSWFPFVSEWTERSVRVRWESLTNTPLELNWMVESHPEKKPAARFHDRLAAAWRQEQQAVERQAKRLKAAFAWSGGETGIAKYADLSAEGFVRPYSWAGRPAALFTCTLAVPGRRLFLSGAVCPPESEREPQGLMKSVLRSLKLSSSEAPLRFAMCGLETELPPDFKVEAVRGQEGHLYVDAGAPGRRVSLARVGLAEWHLAAGAGKVMAALAKRLFDRGEPTDPVTTLIELGAPKEKGLFDRAEPKPPEGAATKVREHDARLYEERVGPHVRFGDAVLRRLGRRHSGLASVLAWHCPDSHALWAIAVRSGACGAEALARSLARQVCCHSPGAQPDWRAVVAAEAGEGGTPSLAEAAGDPAAMRRMQLRFRIRARAEVRMETSSRDQSADLVYEGAPASGLFARLLRGAAPARPSTRRLALDPVGRCTWELLSSADGPTVGRLLGELCNAFAAHPVLLFPRLLAFLKILGERRLVEAAQTEAPSEKSSEKQRISLPRRRGS